MSVIWWELTVALSLVFLDVQGLVHHSLGSSEEKAEPHSKQASFPPAHFPIAEQVRWAYMQTERATLQASTSGRLNAILSLTWVEKTLKKQGESRNSC
jgi:hypothetical protein